MREEIFGPIMPVLPYDTLEDAVATINAGSEPLALYYFGNDAAEKSTVLAHTRSGGVTFNDTHQHYLQEELPFGGRWHLRQRQLSRPRRLPGVQSSARRLRPDLGRRVQDDRPQAPIRQAPGQVPGVPRSRPEEPGPATAT